MGYHHRCLTEANVTVYEIAAVIGAFAWVPTLIKLFRRWFSIPTIRIITQRNIEIGFTSFGPIANLHLAFAVQGRDIVVSNIKMTLEHETHEKRQFSWQGIVQHLGRISNPGTAQIPYDKEQSVLAIKLHERDIDERFIRFQEDLFIANKLPIEEKAAKKLVYLATTQKHIPEDFLESEEIGELSSFIAHSFSWKKGRYAVTFQMYSPQRFRLINNTYSFELNELDIEALEKNKDQMKGELENQIWQGNSDRGKNEIRWNWRFPNLRGT